jgi:rfaE bifunctional protein kinase chain/domain
MDQQRIKEILGKIGQTRVAVYGDFCIDAYWMLDPQGSEVSEETGLQARAVRRHYYSLGGASNVVANLAALKPKSIQVVGVIGDDIFGRELRRQFEQLGVDTSRLVVQKQNYDTVTFGKPYLDEREEPRVDFGFFNKRSAATDAALLEGIRDVLQSVDAMIVNQQVPGSITNESFIEGANALLAACPNKPILLDSRHFGDRFQHIIRKINDREAARLNGVQVARDENPSLDDVKRYAQNLFGWFNKPVFLTRGAKGMLAIDGSGVHQIPGIQLLTKLDPVGAGDTVTSALALCLGAGVPAAEAAEFANFAAAVTVQKLFQTGAASGDEILVVAKDPDFIYQPELAESPRKAKYLPDTEIEITGQWPVSRDSCPGPRVTDHGAQPPIRHAVFDNDGTISTLRQGWEGIMTPVMIKAILGDRYATAEESLYRKVRERVLDFIDKSTGIQTLVQMEGLVGMVREFGIVPSDQVLDRFGYKRIYNDALMEMVNERVAKLKRGQLDVTDFTVKGAVEFLQTLRDRGVTLYLASGTDHADVVAEAEALGHARLFNGGIYGAVGDIDSCSKKMVLDRILKENNLQGPELAVFGDGPVELRESRKRGGLAIGIASDEVRRYGLNLDKRARLIKAGAHVLVSDFSEREELLELLLPKA